MLTLGRCGHCGDADVALGATCPLCARVAGVTGPRCGECPCSLSSGCTGHVPTIRTGNGSGQQKLTYCSACQTDEGAAAAYAQALRERRKYDARKRRAQAV